MTGCPAILLGGKFVGWLCWVYLKLDHIPLLSSIYLPTSLSTYLSLLTYSYWFHWQTDKTQQSRQTNSEKKKRRRNLIHQATKDCVTTNSPSNPAETKEGFVTYIFSHPQVPVVIQKCISQRSKPSS